MYGIKLDFYGLENAEDLNIVLCVFGPLCNQKEVIISNKRYQIKQCCI